MTSIKASIIFCVFAAAASTAQAGRLLQGAARDWGDIGDPSGTAVLAQARHFDGGPGTPKRAVTPEAAESTSNNMYLGLYRRAMGSNAKLPFATVEVDPMATNPDRRKQTVMTRARSAIDTPTGKIDMISGNAQVPAIAMGSAAVAQTFEGALSVAASDAINVNAQTWGKKTTNANSMLTSYTEPVPRASKAASIGLTAQNTGAISLAGPADGNMAVAQAHEVAAVAQASRSNADQWQTDPREKSRKTSG